MKRHVLLFLLLLPIASLHGQTKKQEREARRRIEEIFSGSVQRGRFYKSFHFVNNNGHIYIKVVIHGKEYTFCLDTGALTTVSEELAKELALDSVQAINAMDANKTAHNQTMYRIDRIDLAGISFFNVGCIAADMTTLTDVSCMKIDGLFGVNAIRNCYWKINMRDSTIAFTDEMPEIPPGAKTLHFLQAPGGYIYLPVNYGDTMLYVEFDSGNGRGFCLTDSLFTHSSEYKNGKYATGEGVTNYSLYGKNASKGQVAYSDVGVDNIPFEAVRVNVIPHTLLLLGTSFIRNYETILDWKHHRMCLTPLPPKDDPDKKSMGLTVEYEDGKVIVDFLWKSLPADRAGIQLGDEVVSVNGTNTQHLSHEEYCSIRDAFNGAQVQITVRHAAGGEVNTLLKSEELIK